ncbi:hypothetical protein EXH44_02895 [Actinobacillus indolicus]|uniref:Autotransporter domain-containing protein n=1 Tax=Actinobacillus indolicus TaxID=51049 RepID=A0A4P7CEI2_9PAST|nr:autotransporter domain-containing protein [Actinobacillus indolicus]QBQ63256.1 hypothetical protein EXH44_02895 [Actinobacillus indolicus]
MKKHSLFVQSKSFPFALSALTLLIATASTQSLANGTSPTIEIEKISFGGEYVGGISADGRYIVSKAYNDNGKGRFTLWHGENWQTKTDLGTFRSDNLGWSDANNINADGRYIVGWAENDNGRRRAIVWHGENWQTKTDLGTLASDNSGDSGAGDINADGRYIVGSAYNDNRKTRATLWHGENWQTKTELGTLRSDNLGWSDAISINADGRYIVGRADNDNGEERATLWHGENWQTKTDLGTLKSDNSGNSWATNINADGRYIVGGAENDNGEYRATLWLGENWQTKTDLGTLKSDNSGESRAGAINADGRYIVGGAENDNGEYRATLWLGENWQTKTDLGTLKSDNSGESRAYRISDDGSVIGGWANSDDAEQVATLWKIRNLDVVKENVEPTPNSDTVTENVTPTPNLDVVKENVEPTPNSDTVTENVTPTPNLDVVKENVEPTPNSDTVTENVTPTPNLDVVKVNVEHTRQLLSEMGVSTLALTESQRLALQRLHYYCSPSVAGKFCYQLDAEWSQQGKVKDSATTLGVGYRFLPQLSMNLKFDRSFARHLPAHYRKQSSNHGIGIAFTAHLPTENGEWYLQPSFAWNSYDVQIVRPVLDHTEAGVGNSKMKGKSYRLTVGKTLNFAENKWVDAYVGVEHSQVKRSGYTEQNAEFPVTFAGLTDKNTALFAGIQTKLPITQRLAWLGGVEVARSLNSTPATYNATADYIGQFSYQEESRKNSLKFSTGLNYQITPAIAFSVQPYYNVTGKHHRGVSLGVKGEF